MVSNGKQSDEKVVDGESDRMLKAVFAD